MRRLARFRSLRVVARANVAALDQELSEYCRAEAVKAITAGIRPVCEEQQGIISVRVNLRPGWTDPGSCDAVDPPTRATLDLAGIHRFLVELDASVAGSRLSVDSPPGCTLGERIGELRRVIGPR